MNWDPAVTMRTKLNLRAAEGTLRKLDVTHTRFDFSSNDYFGFARSTELQLLIADELRKYPEAPLSLGATGSRLLSGNTPFAMELEQELAGYHGAESGLIFNSGYAANVSLFSSVLKKGDTVIHDAYIHASVIDGIRLSTARRLKFKHNDPEDLEKKLKVAGGPCYVAVESVYSMDGDTADLAGIVALCRKYAAHLIVDEAHAFGIYGTGLVDQLHLQDAVFARVVTFGKTLGLSGAVVLGTGLLKEYLVNFARPFIYSTAIPFLHLLSIRVAYRYFLTTQDVNRKILLEKCELLKSGLSESDRLKTSRNNSAIQCLYTTGNEEAVRYSCELQEKGFDVRAIRSPTVPKSTERLRICVHTYNTNPEILELCHHISQLTTIR
ncbi:aminotransferase class I/II-fold pyridoxal phosphate-dependent enzyme [Pedobacter metabolipauper]|uniref:8-amino-7-oxononanoate synthase n=1 Tax=Pedobacter metabolipauper TaxID=425513 RepID=A0A4R6SYL0_9SPHI|nr:aminotransferase class I/II-fold pyridoxal phosphate-dependent enzyme [Pedobacter metabolipauper]TDQ11095.1 8-amino-7-oxononanoate synthase [Pedobacter metabolipauper]